MNARDVIYSQNWVEQFRKNRREFIGSEDYNRFENMRRNPFEGNCTPDVAIYKAFTWADTPESEDAWETRCYHIPGEDDEQFLIR